MIDQELSIIFGSRVGVYGSSIKRVALRHYTGRIFATFASFILNLTIYDTQCGLKIFSRKLADELFARPFITKWLFDVEIFARVKKTFYSQSLTLIMREIPLSAWTEKGKSKITLKDILLIPFYLLKIKLLYK